MEYSHLMDEAGPLLRIVEEQRRQFKSACEKARRDPNVNRIHNLRVATRTLIASLELLQSAVDDERIDRVRGDLRKLQKRLGPLRDVQVQLARIGSRSPRASLKLFEKSLKRKERKEAQKTQDRLYGHRFRELRRSLKEIQRKAARVLKSAFPAALEEGVKSVIREGLNDLAAAKAAVSLTDPASLHAVRVAARHLRYLLESAAPVIGAAPADQLEMLRAAQSRLGKIRDLQLLEDDIRQMSKGLKDESEHAEIERYCRALARSRSSQLKTFSAT